MSNEEQLTYIKEFTGSLMDEQGRFVGFDLTRNELDWLIEQAEKVQKLEESKAFYKHLSDSYVNYGNDKLDQVLRYREALEKITSRDSYNKPVYDEYELSWIAKQALEES